MSDVRGPASAVVARICSRLAEFADRERQPLAVLRMQIWGQLFGAVRILGDRVPLNSYSDRGSEFPTVAAAVKDAIKSGSATVADALACASLRQEALLGDGEARKLLDEAATRVTDRLSDGHLTTWPDGRFEFVSDPIALRDFVSEPAAELSRRHRAGLKSRAFRESPARMPGGLRLALLASHALDVLVPFYKRPGHLRVSEKAAGVVKSAQYPAELLEDVADLLIVWREGEFEGLTGEKVRNALRYWLPRLASDSGPHE